MDGVRFGIQDSSDIDELDDFITASHAVGRAMGLDVIRDKN